MKTIANIIIINSQNVKPEHLVISSHHNISFQRRKLCLRQDEFQRSCQLWAAKTAAGWPEILDMHACSYYIATVTATKECSVNPSISSTCMT